MQKQKNNQITNQKMLPRTPIIKVIIVLGLFITLVGHQKQTLAQSSPETLLIAQEESQKQPEMRTFMFVGQPSAKSWQLLMANPQDRKEEVADSMAAIGGKILNYYFGLGDGKNYITVELPNDNELIQAIYLMRLPSGLLDSYQIVELMPSNQMSEALKKSRTLIEQDTSVEQ